jgi:isocitrate dehydrogenase (NAD+)
VDAGDESVPTETVAAIRRHGLALKGPVATPQDGSMASPNIGLRRALGLDVQVRRARALAGTTAPARGLDLLVLREASEDLYAGVGFPAASDAAEELRATLARHGATLPPDAGIAIKYLSETASRRAWEFACELARREGIDHVTAAHKSAVMPTTDGLFVRVGRETAAEHDLELRAVPVDTLVARLVGHPDEHRLIVAPNQYGDILADLAGALAGGLGMVAGGNYGSGVAVFEAAHGAAFRHAGRGTANPLGVVLSAVLLLSHAGAPGAAGRLDGAVAGAVADGVVPAEVAEGAGCSVTTFTEAVLSRMAAPR